MDSQRLSRSERQARIRARKRQFGARPLTFAEIVKILSNTDFADLTGRRFGRLVVVGHFGVTLEGRYGQKRMRRWMCRCDCGVTRAILANSLLRNKSRSCGCLRREVARRRFQTMHFLEKQLGAVAFAGLSRVMTMDHVDSIMANALPKQPNPHEADVLNT
jgi:hypothetical protein